jgi:hypothetical protein
MNSYHRHIIGARAFPLLSGLAALCAVLICGNSTRATVPSEATITFGDLNQVYDGTAKRVSVTTVPPDLTVIVTYNGSMNAPTNVGKYTVVGKISDPLYTGTATNTLVIAAIVINSQPHSVTVALGKSTNLTVEATGAGKLSYQWRKGGATQAGKTNATLNLLNVATNMAGDYDVVIRNNYGSITSAVATITVLLPPTFTTNLSNRSVVLGSNIAFSVTAKGTPPLAYYWSKDGMVLANATNSSLTITGARTNDAGVYNVTVSNVAGSKTSSNAVLTVVEPVKITAQPAGQTVIAGGNVTLAVAATGSTPIFYRWLRNDLAISKATNATLTLSNVATAVAGNYSVIVSNAAGAVRSSNALVSIYIATNQLTVLTNGRGTVSPNYNHVWLQINKVYSMTANAGPGFALRSWTDGQGNVLTTNATLKFVMASNLTLVANFADIARPTLSILSPVANQRWSNAVFKVTGKASDNAAVSNVFYSLNGPAWTAASTTNNWTNWTALVNLEPGTNFLAAYAVDTSGNVSTTNKVSFVYVLSDHLEVQIVGLGTITPNYTNVSLEVGGNYSMTAKASTGFAFWKWSDANGNVLSTNSTLKFVMTSNLTFVAVFRDIARPTLSISSPVANQRWSNAVFKVTGKASDNAAVSNVFYSLNGLGWTAASTTNNWTNWTALVNLEPGTNFLIAYAVDTSGNVSTNNNVSFVYVTVDVAPATLNGMIAAVTPSGQSTFQIAFGTNTFSQFSFDTNNDSAVGNYFYTKLGTNTARLMLTNSLPLTSSNSTTVFLTFTSSNLCTYSNEMDRGDQGTIDLAPQATLVPATLNGFKALFLAPQGHIFGVSFGSGTAAITNTDGTVDTVNYTTKVYSPVGLLINVTQPRSTNYINVGLMFLAANHGGFFITSSADPEMSEAVGVFARLLPATAPASLKGMSARLWDDGVVNQLGFGTNAFSKISTDTNEENGVGVYTYTNTSPNAAQLNVRFIDPPSVINDGASLVLTFVSPDFCLFTNRDDSGSNYLAAMSFQSARQLVPDTLAGKTITATSVDGTVNVLSFNANHTFIQSQIGSNSPPSIGTYTYTGYGPVGAMVELHFTLGAITGIIAHFQVQFDPQTPGMFFVAEFDNFGNMVSWNFGNFMIN